MVRNQEALIGWKPFSDSPRVASARLRCGNPLALLRKAGYPVERYQERNRHRYQVVILQKLFDPEHQTLARRLQAQGTCVVFDLCDNYLYTAPHDAALGPRAENVRRMLEIVDAVTVSTPTLAESLPRPAAVIRDGIEPCGPPGLIRSLLTGRRRQARREPIRRDRLELIWFGTWGDRHVSFGMRDLLEIQGELEDLAARTEARLTVVSNSRPAFHEWIEPLAIPTRYVEWTNHAQLCRRLPRYDACVIPIRRNPYTLCKSPNRLVLSLSLGVPVIATAIPSYEEFGDFCALDDWEGGLQALETGETSLHQRTAAGCTYVQERHLMIHAAQEWGQFLDSLLARDTSGSAVWRQLQGI